MELTGSIPSVLEQLPSSGSTLLLLLVLGLAPVLAVVTTSYLKIAVVLRLVRNALGIQDVPPNLAVSALALILSMYVMAPVGMQMLDALTQPGVDIGDFTSPKTREAMAASLEPLRGFLETHASDRHMQFFADTARELWAREAGVEIGARNMSVLIPAFTTSQLASAFEVAFLLFLPFVAIDLIVSNILLSLGMIMLSPLTVSLPFKLLLFVSADGWTRLIEGLVLSYQ